MPGKRARIALPGCSSQLLFSPERELAARAQWKLKSHDRQSGSAARQY